MLNLSYRSSCELCCHNVHKASRDNDFTREMDFSLKRYVLCQNDLEVLKRMLSTQFGQVSLKFRKVDKHGNRYSISLLSNNGMSPRYALWRTSHVPGRWQEGLISRPPPWRYLTWEDIEEIFPSVCEISTTSLQSTPELFNTVVYGTNWTRVVTHLSAQRRVRTRDTGFERRNDSRIIIEVDGKPVREVSVDSLGVGCQGLCELETQLLSLAESPPSHSFIDDICAMIAAYFG